LKDEPAAYLHFKKLSGSHQKYFSKWIDAAKTTSTKAKRIALAVTALGQQKGYAEMIQMNKREP
ncbi:MAG: YdeI/OmpD-associated family protein, partial [Flammeovirgaceae bacterium]